MLLTILQFTCPPTSLARLVAAVTASSAGASHQLLSNELIYTPAEDGGQLDKELEKALCDLVGELDENPDTLRVWTTLN
jgi:translational activator of cytochrome c oxidase 1